MDNKFKKTKTYKNLEKSFSGESEARLRYGFFASRAKKDGLIHISKVFEETSNNEKEHAEIWYKLLFDGEIPKTADNLLLAASNEKYEWSNMYVKFAKEAKEEGYISISKLFESVAKIEKMHQERYIKLHNELTKNTTFKSNKEEKWFCSNCGAIINSKDAPKKCPVCSHDQGYFIKSDTKIID